LNSQKNTFYFIDRKLAIEDDNLNICFPVYSSETIWFI